MHDAITKFFHHKRSSSLSFISRTQAVNKATIQSAAKH